MIGRSIHCDICGPTKIKGMHRNKYGRELIYQSNFGRKKYCSRGCMMMGVWKRQMIVGIIAISLFSIGEGSMIYITLQWSADWMINAISIVVPLVGVAIGVLILR